MCRKKQVEKRIKKKALYNEDIELLNILLTKIDFKINPRKIYKFY